MPMSVDHGVIPQPTYCPDFLRVTPGDVVAVEGETGGDDCEVYGTYKETCIGFIYTTSVTDGFRNRGVLFPGPILPPRFH